MTARVVSAAVVLCLVVAALVATTETSAIADEAVPTFDLSRLGTTAWQPNPLYDATLGRFTQTDSLSGDSYSYGYANANPVSLRDLSGLSTETLFWYDYGKLVTVTVQIGACLWGSNDHCLGATASTVSLYLVEIWNAMRTWGEEGRGFVHDLARVSTAILAGVGVVGLGVGIVALRMGTRAITAWFVGHRLARGDPLQVDVGNGNWLLRLKPRDLVLILRVVGNRLDVAIFAEPAVLE
ncbi:hypothetical protein BH09ACT1_BH09ACT1_27200 [soil metagenome]